MGYQEEKELKGLLDQAREKLEAQDLLLKKLTSPPFVRATVIRLLKDTLLIAAGGLVEVNYPEDKKVRKKLVPGMVVRLNEAMAIVDAAPDDGQHGHIVKVSKVVGDQIEIGEGERAIRIWRGNTECQEGDRVKVDPGMLVVTENLGKPEVPGFKFEGETHVTWADIGGQDEAKRALHEAVELPFLRPDLYQRYGKKPTKGILLYGPPGCGKTMLAKAAASALAKIHGKASKASGFLYVKGPEVLSKWVGESEETIRSLFTRAREHMKEHGYPAILFIDEAEALLSSRTGRSASGIERTTVPMFLAEMDGLDVNNPLVLLATNRQDQLDPAVTRDGRIDRKIRVSRPTEADAKSIFELYLKPKPLSVSTTEMADACVTALYSPLRKFYDVKLEDGTVRAFQLSNLASGALIHGAVELMTSLAMNREISNPDAEPKGILVEDVQIAFDSIERQNKGLNHEAEIADWLDSQGVKATAIRKVAEVRA